MQTSSPTPSKLTGYIMLASLGLFWGLNWPGMKIALEELPVWWFRSLSVGVGGPLHRKSVRLEPNLINFG